VLITDDTLPCRVVRLVKLERGLHRILSCETYMQYYAQENTNWIETMKSRGTRFILINLIQEDVSVQYFSGFKI
jgi:hypothetical protein